MRSRLTQSEALPVSALYAQAYLIRAFEQRLLQLFSEGRLSGTVHTCIGQEFTGIAVAAHLQPGDLIFSNHRCHGHYLARTGDVEGLLAEIMGRETGICGGRGGSQHICGGGVFSNGIQGGIAPVAAGYALAQQLIKTGNIVTAFFGDGTLGEGVLYETLNIASKWQLPMLFVLENNGYSQSTSAAQTLAGDIELRAKAFGIPAFRGDAWHPERLHDVVGRAIRHVREETGPAFIRIDTYRLMAHSKGDDLRSRDELQHYWAIDPLIRFAEEQPGEAAQLRTDADARIAAAVEAAGHSGFASIRNEVQDVPAPTVWRRTVIDGSERVVARIYAALRDRIATDNRAVILGEDVEAPYGGAFKVTRDLSAQFPSRVRNTPVSEAAVVGLGNGLAMAGMRPICEIMFGDFLALAADQIINHAAKFQWMYNNQVSVPLVIRTPMGGRRGYGPTHSQCLEKHFLGIPGTWVLAVHPRFDPCALYQSLFAAIDRPVLVIENKAMYGEPVTHATVPGFWCEYSDERFPTTRIRSSAKPQITIVCYGGMLQEAEQALDRLFDEHEIAGEIICPTLLFPLNLEPLLESARISRRLLVVEEGQLFCGFGSEVLAAVFERCPHRPVFARRLGPAQHPIPAGKAAEMASLPGVNSIVSECVDMVNHG